MSEHQIKLSGWQIIVAGLVLIGVLGFRLATFSEQKDNSALVEKLELHLTSEYFPDDVDALRTALASGDEQRISEVAQSVSSTKLKFKSVKTSAPLFDFSSNRKVIVKVTYSLDDVNGTRQAKTDYYQFRHAAIGNTWEYKYESSALMYYLNFL